MIKIGIIGTENSHAMAFAKYLSTHNEARVTALYGPDPEPAEKIRQEAGVEFIASDPAEFFGRVDAVMVTSRRGSVHAGYALPFIRKGMPVFIDKPVTSSYAEAKYLAAEAARTGAPLCGGSACKLAPDVVELKNRAQKAMAEGSFITGCINFTSYPDSEYDGFFFYASHLVEMAMTAFGYNPRSVLAASHDATKSATAILRYDSYDVTLCFTARAAKSSAMVYTAGANFAVELDTSDVYGLEAEQFLTMIRTREQPYPSEELIKPVAVIEAVVRSYTEGREVVIEQ